jgi:hypothetical protein
VLVGVVSRWVHLLAVFPIVLTVISLLLVSPVIFLVATPGAAPVILEALVVLTGPVIPIAFFQVFLLSAVVVTLHKGQARETNGGLEVVRGWCRVLSVFHPFLVEGRYCAGTGLVGSETYFVSTGIAASILRKSSGWKLCRVAVVRMMPGVCLIGLEARLCRIAGVRRRPRLL